MKFMIKKALCIKSVTEHGRKLFSNVVVNGALPYKYQSKKKALKPFQILLFS